MKQRRRIPARSDLPRLDAIDSKTPLRLAVAAALAYPDGSTIVSRSGHGSPVHRDQQREMFVVAGLFASSSPF